MNQRDLDEQIKQLNDLIWYHRQAYEKVTAPLWETLHQLYAMRGPDPIVVPRGSVTVSGSRT